jgi:transposase-like protein
MVLYGDECLSRTQVFKWFKRFREGRGEIEDDLCTGQPCTSKTDANTEKVGELVRKNRCLSIRAVAELANIDKENA